MHLRQEVKGGILLYALLILSIFSLFLSFFIRREAGLAMQVGHLRKSSQARLIAKVCLGSFLQEEKQNTKNEKSKSTQTKTRKSYHKSFKEGDCRLTLSQEAALVEVVLSSGERYTYRIGFSSISS